jgi:hypothetical protein
MSYSYGWEKLHLAVHSLAGLGNQADRLVNATAFSLINITPENDLPIEIQEDFETLMSELTVVKPTGDEGSIRATINTFGEVELTNAIEKIIGFYDTICRHREPN